MGGAQQNITTQLQTDRYCTQINKDNALSPFSFHKGQADHTIIATIS